MLKGRQILYMIVSFFTTNRQMEFVYGVEDLTAIHWLGGKDLHLFRHKWNEVAESMADKLGQDALAHILVKKLDSSNEFKGDLDLLALPHWTC